MNKLIYISGIDGAGKTTISKALLNKFKPEKAHYSWATLRPFFLLPFIKFFKYLFVRKYNKFSDYSFHKQKKRESLKKISFLLVPQFIVALFDYYPQFLYKIFLKSFKYRVIIADRYYVDFFIERGMLADWNPQKTLEYILFFDRFFIIPNHTFYLKVNAETAFSRKNDIPSIEYLNDRAFYYDYIHNKLGSKIINANGSIDNILNNIMKDLK